MVGNWLCYNGERLPSGPVTIYGICGILLAHCAVKGNHRIVQALCIYLSNCGKKEFTSTQIYALAGAVSYFVCECVSGVVFLCCVLYTNFLFYC